MLRAALFALAAISTAVFPLRASAQDDLPKMSDGYTNSPPATDVFQMAPAGYEGNSETYTTHAVSNTPATAGKSFVSKFTMRTQVQSCPQADGTVEGEGELTGILDFTSAPPELAYNNSQTGSTSKLHVSVSAKAKFKGTVGDDAMLKDPVTAEIDYSFDQSGSTRQQTGAMTSPTSSHDAHHLTIEVHVVPGESAPTLSKFEGGDPSQGHLKQAQDVGAAVAFFGGVYYSTAESHWVAADSCAKIVFDPPSRSRLPVPGSNVKVNGSITTKGGQGVRGKFVVLKPLVGGGTITAVDESTDPGSPAILTYTAPNTRVDSAGFGAAVTSRAGTANANWVTGLGSEWSGQIYASRIIEGDAGHDELQTWSTSQSTQITIDVRDGVATASGYAEMHDISENRHHVADGHGGSFLEFDNGGNIDASSNGTSKAELSVSFDTTNGTYSVSASYPPFPAGRQNVHSCIRANCTSENRPFGVPELLRVISGKSTDLNHVSGSQSEVFSGLGRSRKGKSTFTLTWDLARQGTTK